MGMSHRLLRPRASSTFSPTKIAGLSLWLDASDTQTLFDATSGGSTPSADGSVARWVDKSTNAYEFTQSTANNRPLRKTSSQNGKDGLLFDGTNDAMYKEAQVFTAGVTIIVVTKLTSASVRAAVIDVGNYSANGNKSLAIEANTYLSASNKWGLFVAANSPTVNSTYEASASTSTNAAIIAYAGNHALNSDITSNAYRVNGVACTLTRRYGGADASADYSSVSGVMISAFNAAGTPGGLGGQTLYEVIVYNSKLSTADCQSVESYLSKKWGITI